MEPVAKSDYIDATHIWHGYTYQGKIALLTVLKSINSFYDNGSVADINNYYLELERLEDFSVLKNKNGRLSYESIHQVKAKANKSISDYGDALETLARKLHNNTEIENAYLHVERDLSYTPAWHDSVKKIVTELKYTKNILEKIQVCIDNADERQKILNQYAKNHKGRKSDLSKNLLHFYQKPVDASNICDALTSYRDEIENSINLLSLNFDDSLLAKIQLYEYSFNNINTPYCKPDDLESHIVAEILTYYENSKSIPFAIKNSPFLKVLESSDLICVDDRTPVTFLLENSNSKKELHLLSAMKKEEGKLRDERFCRDIIENKNANKILYDYDVIIAHGIEAETVAKGAGDLWRDFQDSDNIYYLKDVRIENIDKYL